MLNDHVRNHMYDSAISRAVHAASARVGRGKVATKRPSVLDCGCGAGLLSLMATRAGAGAVCAMELSPVIADIAEQTFSVNLSEQKHHHPQTSISTASKIQLLAGDVRSFSTDQVGRHDVIICELMDASGVGESLLGVLAHACTFFAAPLAQVIPCKLRLSGGLGYLALPECHGSLNFAAFEPFYFCARRGGPFSADSTPRELQGGGIATPSPTLPALHTGPFASKNLNRLRRGERWDLLTFEAAFLEFDIASALRGSAMHPREAEVELVVKSSGVVNCIQWCWSAKLDEHETLSNRPLEAGGLHQTHWPTHPCESPTLSRTWSSIGHRGTSHWCPSVRWLSAPGTGSCFESLSATQWARSCPSPCDRRAPVLATFGHSHRRHRHQTTASRRPVRHCLRSH
mmetsp:Transcript_139215/g.444945  ORF Transcript_139215/g.444945 Transcript_139215/m.444945 type:complete len:401 (+) Transcript_139215:208-1410(+)